MIPRITPSRVSLTDVFISMCVSPPWYVVIRSMAPYNSTNIRREPPIVNTKGFVYYGNDEPENRKPSASRRRPEELRAPARRGAQGLHEEGAGRVPGGDRPHGGGGHRHAVSPLPNEDRPAAVRLRRADRGVDRASLRAA